MFRDDPSSVPFARFHCVRILSARRSLINRDIVSGDGNWNTELTGRTDIASNEQNRADENRKRSRKAVGESLNTPRHRAVSLRASDSHVTRATF
jgi:hypothetical protein